MKPAAGLQVTSSLRLVKPVGRGGMGSVWVAYHDGLQAQVAIKFVHAEVAASNPAVVARFKREAGITAKLRSPHAVQTYDHGLLEDGTPYIVMELLEGESLQERLARDKSLSLQEVALVVTQTAQVLTRAHDMGVVHRDIKPANLFLVDTGYELFIKLLDFGIAKHAGAFNEVHLTSVGSMLGSPLYMSPEQFTSSKEVDYRGDLWSLAVVAYHCLAGTPAFQGETLGQVMMAVMSFTYEPLSQRCGELSAALDPWFERAFHSEIEQRFQSAKEMADGFVEALRDTAEPSSRHVRVTSITDLDTGERSVESARKTTPLEAVRKTTPLAAVPSSGRPLSGGVASGGAGEAGVVGAAAGAGASSGSAAGRGSASGRVASGLAASGEDAAASGAVGGNAAAGDAAAVSVVDTGSSGAPAVSVVDTGSGAASASVVDTGSGAAPAVSVVDTGSGPAPAVSVVDTGPGSTMPSAVQPAAARTATPTPMSPGAMPVARNPLVTAPLPVTPLGSGAQLPSAAAPVTQAETFSPAATTLDTPDGPAQGASLRWPLAVGGLAAIALLVMGAMFLTLDPEPQSDGASDPRGRSPAAAASSPVSDDPSASVEAPASTSAPAASASASASASATSASAPSGSAAASATPTTPVPRLPPNPRPRPRPSIDPSLGF